MNRYTSDIAHRRQLENRTAIRTFAAYGLIAAIGGGLLVAAGYWLIVGIMLCIWTLVTLGCTMMYVWLNALATPDPPTQPKKPPTPVYNQGKYEYSIYNE